MMNYYNKADLIIKQLRNSLEDTDVHETNEELAEIAVKNLMKLSLPNITYQNYYEAIFDEVAYFQIEKSLYTIMGNRIK